MCVPDVGVNLLIHKAKKPKMPVHLIDLAPHGIDSSFAALNSVEEILDINMDISTIILFSNPN